MALYEAEYNEYSILSKKLFAFRKELKSKWRRNMNWIFSLLGIFGLFLIILHFAQVKHPELIKELDATILNKCMLFKNFDIFLIAFSIVNLVIVNVRENARKDMILKKMAPLCKRESELLSKFESRYKEYKNPPLPFAFSSPDVLDIIINMLESDEHISIEGAAEKCEKLNKIN